MSTTRITVRVQPRASANEVGELTDDGTLRVRVTAAPADGAANDVVTRTLAKALGVGRSRVVIIRGATSRVKVIEIDGLDEAEIRSRLCQNRRPPRQAS